MIGDCLAGIIVEGVGTGAVDLVLGLEGGSAGGHARGIHQDCWLSVAAAGNHAEAVQICGYEG